MTPRALARSVTPPWGRAAVRRARDARAGRRFAAGRGVPWTAGYAAARDSLVRSALDSEELLDAFRRHEPLPPGYGVGVDERCIECPWIVGRLGRGSERMLDAGSALNHSPILSRPELREKRLHILTLAPEREAHWEEGISYIYADLRDIPIRDGYYDVVASVSTLEHIGSDNAQFTREKRSYEEESGDRVQAVVELRRVLRPGGRLLFTVPFGVRRSYGTFEQFDADLLAEVVHAFSGEVTAAAFYRYEAGGWRVAAAEECSDAEYSASAAELWRTGRLPDPSTPEADRAAAARAVACVEIVKPRAGDE